MAMDTIFATLACYLLALSIAVVQTKMENLTATPITTSPGLNLTHTTTIVPPSNSTAHVPGISNMTESTTPLTGTTQDNDTFTKTTTENTSHLQTSPLTNSTITLTTTTPGTHTPTFTALTMPATRTTEGYTSTPGTTGITTGNSSHTVNTTLDSMDTQGLGLNISEKNMTILFSVVLGVFATALVAFMFHRCKLNIQYLHQPLNNTDDTDEFVADNDTLVISGGLYDGLPIYDNVPTVPAEQSQFRLEFLH